MEQKQKYRTSLERKFFTAIFWVGVIPMTLTLIVAYIFAREGQWITAKKNLTSTVKITTEGIRLSLSTRLTFTSRIVTDPIFSQFCEKPKEERELFTHQIEEKITTFQSASEGKSIAIAITDIDNNLLYSTPLFKLGSTLVSDWYKKIHYPEVIAISTPPQADRYTLTIAVPIRNSNNKIVGFLLEIQEASELIHFALAQSLESSIHFENIYFMFVYLRDNDGISVFCDNREKDGKINFNYEISDARLVQRLKRISDKTEGLITLLRFSSQGKNFPILLAYQKIHPEYDLYFCAYRHLDNIFWFIHVGSIVALIVAGMVILFFSLISYRIVHRNILRPLSLINEGAQIIRQGDLELKLKIETGDELEEVAHSFNEMASALKKNIYELETSEERYRNIVNSMRDGIYQANKEGILTFINPFGAKILGFNEPEKAIGTRIENLFLNLKDFKVFCSDLEKNGYLNQFRTWVKTITGELICVEISAGYMKDEHSKIIGIEGIFRDITQNVLLENEVQERAERLRAVNIIARTINSSLEAGKLYETIVNEIKQLIDTIDYALVAFPPEKLGHPQCLDFESCFEILTLLPSLETEARMGNFYCGEKVIREERTLIFDYLQSEDDTIAKEFPPEITSLAATPLFAEEKVIGVLVVGSKIPKAFSPHDIEIIEEVSPHIAVAIRNARLLEKLQNTLDEINRAREQLNKANEELKTLDEMKTNLLSNVSHELRTPLVSVMGYTDMILKGKTGPINDTQREYLSISIRNVEKLVNLIENLLDFSKLHKGKEELVFSTFDIVECAEIGLQNIRPMADPRGIQLILNAEQKPILVDGDKGKILQVFNNLLSNAVKFNKNEGSVEVRIKIIEEDVEVSVIDTGIGIPPEAIDKIFTRFYQVDSSSTRKYGGTGIGLSISQDIMRLHGSRIVLTSTQGKGSIFSFRLPIHGTRSEENRIYARQITPDETHLLVELVTQDRSLSAQIRHWLLEENIDILHSGHPSTAISLALKYNPDCIIIDCDEGPLGELTISEILGSPGVIEIPIILITGNEQLYTQYSDKVIHWLPKQLRKSILLSAIRYAIKNIPLEECKLGDTILCVDDDVEILQFMKNCLETEGYKVDIATSGEECIEKAQTGQFRLILLDIAMPGLDGIEVCRIIRTNPKLKGICIHIVTAKPINEVIKRTYEVEADGILQKPFKQEDLISIVKNYIPKDNI